MSERQSEPWVIQIQGLADGQLSSTERDAAQRRLESDPQAKAEYQWTVLLREALPNHCRPIPSPETWRGALARLDEIDRVSSTTRLVNRYAWVACSVMLVGLLATAWINRTQGTNAMTSGQLASLVSNLSEVPQTAYSGPGGVQRLLESTLATPSPAPLTDEVRIRKAMTAFDGKRHLVLFHLSDSRGDFCFYAIERASSMESLQERFGSRYLQGQMNGVPIIAWSDGGHLFMVAADRPAQELLQIAQAIHGGLEATP